MDKADTRVLVLGHNGMLGHVVCRSLKENKLNISTTENRFPSKGFIEDIINSDADFLINCIGSIPQKNDKNINFLLNNFLLPVFLSSYFKNKIIHPSSDCENIDPEDFYADSKTKSFEFLKDNENAYIIKCSVIGPELNSKKSLWEWLTSNKNGKVLGYTNHFWNGITTLRWSEIALKIIKGEIKKNLIIVGTKKISKFDLLDILNKKLDLNIKLIKYSSDVLVDRYIPCEIVVENIEKQIHNLIMWYNK